MKFEQKNWKKYPRRGKYYRKEILVYIFLVTKTIVYLEIWVVAHLKIQKFPSSLIPRENLLL